MTAFLLLLALMLQQPPPAAGIEGFVLRAGTNPESRINNARIELTGAAGTYVTRTDNSGAFAIGGLAPGVFRLRVAKDGFIRQEYPSSPMDEPGLLIRLAAGQTLKDIVFRLEPAPTIGGMLRDESESPVAGVEVRALKRIYTPRGTATLRLLASTRTDDRGRYRLFWLDPGEYFVVALTAPSAPLDPASAPGGAQVSWAPTYYPGYVDANYARSIQLERGRDVEGIDFKLVRQSLLTLSGWTTSLTTRRAVQSTVTLAAIEDGAGVARHTVTSSSDGAYTFRGIAPGTYILSASSGSEMVATSLQLRNSALRMDLRLGPGVPINGRVFSAGGSSMDLRNVRVRLSEEHALFPQPPTAAVGINSQFLLPAVQPGTYTLSVDGLPPDTYMKAAAFNDADALTRPILPSYQSTAELNIELADDGGRLEGAALDANDRPFRGAQVLLIPVDARSRLDLYKSTVSAENGTFTIGGIAPGAYRAFAWSSIVPYAYFNIEYMRAYESLGIPVEIGPRLASSVQLRVIAAP